MKILICGIGAIGSNLVAKLAPDLKGLHEITILDKDVVEDRNVSPGTQFYTSDQIGLPKVEALQFNIYKWYQKEINIISGKLGRGGPLIQPYQLVIDCLDNHTSRSFLQSEYMRNTLLSDQIREMLHIGFSDNYTFSIEWAENYKVPSDITKGFDICEMPGAAAFVSSVSSIGALVAEEYIHNKKKIEIVGGKFIHTIVK